MTPEAKLFPAPEIHDDGSTDERISAAANAHVNVNRLEFSDRALSIIAVVFSSVAIVLTLTLSWEVGALMREAKQVQIQLMYANAIMLREGLVQPGDMVYGPEGNLEYRQHELKRK